MASPIEIRLCGEGGQGLVLAGVVLAQAALNEGKAVAQTQAYGPTSRGGASLADVIIGSAPIVCPLVSELDLLVALAQSACDEHSALLKPEGLLVVDTFRVPKIPEGIERICAVPIFETARRSLGRAVAGNMVALGCISGLTGIVSLDALRGAIAGHVPKGHEEINRKALEAGFALGETARAA